MCIRDRGTCGRHLANVIERSVLDGGAGCHYNYGNRCGSDYDCVSYSRLSVTLYSDLCVWKKGETEAYWNCFRIVQKVVEPATYVQCEVGRRVIAVLQNVSAAPVSPH